MNPTFATTLALAGAVVSPLAWSAAAATLLFTQPGTQIVSENGVPRPAKRGDVLQTGERLRTPPGAISQLQLTDGSLIGMRPDSELRIDLPTSMTGNTQQVVSLLQGAARVIGSELMDAKRTSAFTLQSGLATLKLQGADLESAVVKADLGKPAGVTDPGSYSRLLVGTGSISNGTLVEPLVPRQISFVATANAAPLAVSSVSPGLFATPLPVASSGGLSTLNASPATTPTATTAAPTITTMSPSVSGLLVQPMPTTVTPITSATVAAIVVPPVVAIIPSITVTPILATPITALPTATKLPLLSCKVRGTC